MLNDDILGYMLSNAHNSEERKMVDVKPDISEQEALDIFNELIDIFKKHNVSYQCACRLSIALTDCFISGAIELYNIENGIPTNRANKL